MKQLIAIIHTTGSESWSERNKIAFEELFGSGGRYRDFGEVTGRRLIHVHAHDNRGQWDDHLIPGDGHINWTIVRDSLEAAAFDGWIMLELSCPDADDSTYFRRAVGRAAELFSQ